MDPARVVAVAFRFNPSHRWDWTNYALPRSESWPARRMGELGRLQPGLLVAAWQSGRPSRRGIRALGLIEGLPTGPLEESALPGAGKQPRGWSSSEEYAAAWKGAWAVPIQWRVAFAEPIHADQSPVCRPIPQAPNPFLVFEAEWKAWMLAVSDATGISADEFQSLDA